jgi:transcriptional regulator with XRE-family HTH domain
MATEFLRAFGRAVRRLRQERGMTQAELAVRLNLGRTSITNLEKGQQSPPLSLLPEIASALGIDPRLLVSEALRGDVEADAGALAATVHDEDLRRWAGQVIGGTPTLQAPPARSSRAQRRPA